MSNESQRDRGALTPEDRKYLRGETGDLADGSEYNIKRRIRERVEDSILDFTILFENLPGEEAEKIFKTEEGDPRVFREGDFASGARDALAFLLYHSDITAFMRVGNTRRDNPAERLLEDAYTRAGRKDEFLVEDVERPSIQATHLRNVLRDLEKGKDVHPVALGKVLETDILEEDTVDEIRELVRTEVVGEEQ